MKNQAKEKERRHCKNKQKYPALGEKQGFRILKTNNNRKRQLTNKNNEGLGPSEVAKKGRKKEDQKKNEKYRKRNFSVISQNVQCLSFFCSKELFDNLDQKRGPQNTIKIGVSANQKKQLMVFWAKTPKPEIPVIDCLLCVFEQQNTKNCYNTYLSCFSKKTRKDIF